ISTKETALSEKKFGIKVFKINTKQKKKNKKFVIWQWLFQHQELIKKADLIHCHDVFYWYLPFRFIYPQKPVFTTFHGYEGYPIKKRAILIRKISEKLSWGNLCIGDFISKWYGTKPTYVSYGAAASSKFKVLPQGQESSKLNKESAVFVGRLDEQTGILTYAEAVQILKQKYPKFTFLAIGDGKYKKIVEKKNKVLGFIENPEKYFRGYRFAFVSRYLSILEAFAAKRLVFAVYDNPVKEDYLKMSPLAKLMIIENNTKNLAEKIEMFLNNPEKEKQLVDKAYEWVKKQSWEELVKLYLRLWKVN
ncbi:MAG TPA: glycosyltransferase family 4 protein, partial [Patescibacteria group bacterium]